MVNQDSYTHIQQRRGLEWFCSKQNIQVLLNAGTGKGNGDVLFWAWFRLQDFTAVEDVALV